MPNGDELLDDLKLDEIIKTWSTPEQFLARNLMAVKRECKKRRACAEFQFSKRQIIVGTSGVGGISLIVTIIFELGKRLLGG